MKVSLIIPTLGGNIENFKRTVDSCRDICDDVVAVSTCLYGDELEQLKKVANTVVELMWNFTYLNGFAKTHNAGASSCKNDWIIRLDVAETFYRPHKDVSDALSNASIDSIFSCDHLNDTNTWRRIWNKSGEVKWDGIIHETLYGGVDSGLLFEMRDTPKTPTGNQERDQTRRWQKSILYHALHIRLRENPSLLGATDPEWLNFLDRQRMAMDEFEHVNHDLFEAFKSGDLNKFKSLVTGRVSRGRMAYGVDFSPTGAFR